MGESPFPAFGPPLADSANRWGFPPQVTNGPPSNYDEKYLQHGFSVIQSPFVGAWDAQAIRAARGAHQVGQFVASTRLLDEFTNDDAFYAAMLQRCAPAVGLERAAVPGKDTSLGCQIAEECEALLDDSSPSLSFGTALHSYWTAAGMGACILQNTWLPLPDGSRLVPYVKPWPMEHAWFNFYLGKYQVNTSEGVFTVQDGDGKWTVIEPFGPLSFLRGAVRPLALPYVDKGYATRDRSSFSAAHGGVSVMGELPPGIKPSDPQGVDMLKVLNDIRTKARSGGLLPAGSKAEFLEAKSRTWEIWNNTIQGQGEAIYRILLGQSETMGGGGKVYTAPIFEGVLWALVDADTRGFAGGVSRGIFRPYAVLNYGRPELAATLKYLLPDPREAARHKSLLDRNAGLGTVVAAWRGAGLDPTQADVDQLAKDLSVRSVKLAAKPPPAPDGGGAFGQGPAPVDVPKPPKIKEDDG